jgi:hypothetical protein
MKYIKTYEIFGGLKKFFKRTPKPLPKVYNNIDDILDDKSLSHSKRVEKIDILCKKYKIRRYTLNSDYSIDCDYPVNLDSMGLYEIPLKFRKVFSFSIKNNYLKSLKNCPIETNYLSATDNQIESLEFCPKIVNSLSLQNNKIKSIEGIANCDFINLENNEISDISYAINLSNYTYFNLSYNDISELSPLNKTAAVYVTHNPIHSILLRLYNFDNTYPDSTWIDGFNSYNIIYNDGIGKPKLFTDNLLNFKNMSVYSLKSFINMIEEKNAYEITTMEEYFNKQKD